MRKTKPRNHENKGEKGVLSCRKQSLWKKKWTKGSEKPPQNVHNLLSHKMLHIDCDRCDSKNYKTLCIYARAWKKSEKKPSLILLFLLFYYPTKGPHKETGKRLRKSIWLLFRERSLLPRKMSDFFRKTSDFSKKMSHLIRKSSRIFSRKCLNSTKTSHI